MRMSIAVSILVFLISCQSDKAGMDKFEQEICDCTYAKYDSIGIDLKIELDNFEDHLISTGQLKDRSGKSYYEIYREITEDNDIPIISNYKRGSLTPEVFPLFSDCFYMFQDDPELTSEKSKMRLIYNAFDSISTKGTASPSIVASAIIDVLDPSDFEKEIYRTYALLTWYFVIPEDHGINDKLPVKVR